MASFGEGLGTLVGGALAANDLEKGVDKVNGISDSFGSSVAPYNTFGQSWLPGATDQIDAVLGKSREVKGYDQFMKDYTASPGAQYVIGQANEAQNNSAAAKGKLLSGSNLRSLSSINEGLSSTFANQAYEQYRAGNQQQFGQLETALGNMFQAIGVGTTATGQQASVATGQMNANAQLAAAQAKNSQSKGSGFGSIFSGLGSLATMF